MNVERPAIDSNPQEDSHTSIENERKAELTALAEKNNMSQEELKGLVYRVEEKDNTEEQIVEGLVGGVNVKSRMVLVSGRDNSISKEDFEGTVDGKSLNPDDAHDVFFHLRDVVSKREYHNSQAVQEGMDALEKQEYEKEVGVLRNRVLGKN